MGRARFISASAAVKGFIVLSWREVLFQARAEKDALLQFMKTAHMKACMTAGVRVGIMDP